MKTIIITARFEVRFKKRINAEAEKCLKRGMRIDDLIGDDEAYRLLATEGDCEMDWDYVDTKPTKKKKTRR